MICPEPEEPRDAGSGHAGPDRGALQLVCGQISWWGGCVLMGEPPAPTAPGGSAVGLDALIATKLRVPRARRGLVPRPPAPRRQGRHRPIAPIPDQPEAVNE